MSDPRVSDADRVLRDPERLAAVRRTRLLDSPTEDVFDRLTRLAAKLIGAPVTFISLVDEDRDFYKSCFGLDETCAGRTHRSGWCSRRIATGRERCRTAAGSSRSGRC